MTKRRRKAQPAAAPQHLHPPKSHRPLWTLGIAAVLIIGLIAIGIGKYVQARHARIQAEQLVTLERRVNGETAWGKKVSQWVTQQLTAIKSDTSVFSPMRYSIRNDVIFINPDLDLPFKQKISDARKGHLSVFAMRFHEELHRAQENKSRWGALWCFLRKTNQMDGYFHRPGAQAHVASVHASNEEWLSLSHALTGSTSLSLRDAPNNVGVWRERMRKTEPERNLLKEIHAYWTAEVISVDDLYRHLYQYPHASYADLHRIDKKQFARLCKTVDLLYAYFEGDFDQLAAFVGNAANLADFEQSAKALIDGSDKSTLEQKKKQMWQEKQEWRDMTARLAKEILGQ